MKKIILISSLLLAVLTVAAQQNLKLWYNKPAKNWVEALPIGNGKIGAMVFGGMEEELIQLNESTLWSGGPVPKTINPTAFQYLSQAREALFNQDFSKANALTKKMQGLYTQTYLPLCDVVIKQNFGGAKPTKYYRDVNIGKAVATTAFSVNGVDYTREIFASYPNNIIVIKITSSQKNKLNFTIGTSSQLHFSVAANGNNELVANGKAPAHADPSYYNKEGRTPIIWNDTTGCNGMRFQYRIKTVLKDGVATADATGIRITNASEVIVYFVAATSFNGFDKCPDSQGKDEKHIADSILHKALQLNYATLLNNHIADYQKYFNRVSLNVKDTLKNNPTPKLATDDRLKAYTAGKYDPELETLFFQYGRYLLISASRADGPPANLQGIWNKELRAPWSSNYTININTEMNYWPAEVTNLPEMHEALLKWLTGLSVVGSNTAKEFYHANGWVAHHNSDIWCAANPVGDRGDGDPVWANWEMGGNWLCRHLWEHYQFTKDKKFLADYAYPIMKQAAVFCLDWLIEDKNGYLVTAPSTSPEHKFKDSSGREQSLAPAATMDMAVIKDLFGNLIAASTELNIDAAFKNILIEKKKKLYPFHIGSQGQLLEWYKEYDDAEIQHRHISHLYGWYPGNEIKNTDTALANAVKRTLEIRGDGAGWGKAWRICQWARLHDAEHCYKLVREMLTYAPNDYSNSGVMPNLFGTLAPFQMDANFGSTAGIAEMLIQSHSDEIYLLPALPTVWNNGIVKGLVARGAFVINMEWEKSVIKKISILSKAGNACVVHSSTRLTAKGTVFKEIKSGSGYKYEFNTVKGILYQFIKNEK
ncbi:MAG TPA: glycoside hydrolase family 95 protein [Chitinophagaceae bacterium]|nr:glycoside hydrolase family 95 protein [Chitinophagaceae bacterium]